MTELDRLELEIQYACIARLTNIIKRAKSLDISDDTRVQVGYIIDKAEELISELSGFGGDY